jgi:hypothetical protein
MSCVLPLSPIGFVYCLYDENWTCTGIMNEHPDKAIRALEDKFVPNETLSKQACDALRRGRTLSDFIDGVRDGAGASADDISRLELLKKLLQITDGNWEMLQLLKVDGNIRTLADVATKYCKDDAWSGITDKPAVTKAQSALFRAEPARVAHSLTDSGIQLLPEQYSSAFKALLVEFIAYGSSMWTVTLSSFYQLRSKDPAAQQGGLLERLKEFQRLAPLVIVPTNIPVLAQFSYSSAQAIAEAPRVKFRETVKRKGMPEEHADSIHSAAMVVTLRNEEAWIHLVRARQKEQELVVQPYKAPGETTTTTNAPPSKTIEHYNMTEMFSLELNEVEEGYSVTSLSAYYVDLLRLLKSSKCNQPTGTILTVYDGLVARRPDLPNLQLSHENDSVLVDYIDLANEVMESYIIYLNVEKQAAVVAHDVPVGTQEAEKQSYTDYLCKELYPFTTSPYLYDLDIVRSLLSAMKYSRAELLQALRSPEYISATRFDAQAKAADLVTHAGVRCGIDLAAERAIAAEQLSLSAEDFSAITGESFWPRAVFSQVFHKSLEGHLEDSGLNLGPAALWGY